MNFLQLKKDAIENLPSLKGESCEAAFWLQEAYNTPHENKFSWFVMIYTLIANQEYWDDHLVFERLYESALNDVITFHNYASMDEMPCWVERGCENAYLAACEQEDVADQYDDLTAWEEGTRYADDHLSEYDQAELADLMDEQDAWDEGFRNPDEPTFCGCDEWGCTGC